MSDKFKIIDSDEPSCLIHFPSSKGIYNRHEHQTYYHFANDLIRYFRKELDIEDDKLIGFVADPETMVFLISDLIEGYLLKTDSLILTPVVNDDENITDLNDPLFDNKELG
jgi:hypothetical protein